jgi:hypothetical protein
MFCIFIPNDRNIFFNAENEMAEVTLRKAAITPFLIFSVVKFAARRDALAAI